MQNGATCQNSTVATTATVTATRTLIESLRREENDVTLRVRSSPTNSDIPRSPKRMELFHFNPELVAHHVAGSLKEQKLLLLDGEIRGSSLPRGPASELSNSDCSIGDLTHHFSYPVNEDVPLTSSEIRETII